MGKGLCCAHDRDLIYDIIPAPKLLWTCKNKCMPGIIHKVHRLETNTENQKCSNSAHSDLQQCRDDKTRIWPPKIWNVAELPVSVKEYEVERNITSPMSLRKQNEASFKLSSIETESAGNLSLGKNIMRKSQQYQDSESPNSKKVIKTPFIPNELANELSRWTNSEKIGLNVLIDMPDTDTQPEVESTAAGDETSLKKCDSEFETQRWSSSTNFYVNKRFITPAIGLITTTTSTNSEQHRAEASYLNKRYLTGTWMDDGSLASESSDCTSQELINFLTEEFLTFSKTQLERSRRRSLFASKNFADLPPLSQALEEMSRVSWTDINGKNVAADQASVVSPGTVKKSSTGSLHLIMADMELLEQSINKITRVIHEIREQSVDILTTDYDSYHKYESGGDATMSKWLTVEKKLKQLQDERRDLEKRKDTLLSQLKCLNALKPDKLQNSSHPIKQESPPQLKFEETNRSPPSKNYHSRLSFISRIAEVNIEDPAKDGQSHVNDNWSGARSGMP